MKKRNLRHLKSGRKDAKAKVEKKAAAKAEKKPVKPLSDLDQVKLDLLDEKQRAFKLEQVVLRLQQEKLNLRILVQSQMSDAELKKLGAAEGGFERNPKTGKWKRKKA